MERVKEWEEAHAVLLSDLKAYAEFLKGAEDKLRELTLKAYAETGNKVPAVGVSVKIFQTLDYDVEEAKRWAMQHQLALQLDRKAFDAIARINSLEFVTIKDKPRAQIAVKLS